MANYDDFLGSISMMAFPWATLNTALCNGAVLPINQNMALFALLGANFGGNGTTNFALPNFNSRMPMGQGQGTGLSPRPFAETGGQETVTLTTAQMPQHTHPVSLGGSGATDSTTGAALQGTTAGSGVVATMQPIGIAGQSIPVPTMPPMLTVSFIITLDGVWPARH